MLGRILCWCVVLFIATVSASEPQLLRADYQSAVDGLKRQYFVYLPQGYDHKAAEKWPVLLFLHGNGERGNWQVIYVRRPVLC